MASRCVAAAAVFLAIAYPARAQGPPDRGSPPAVGSGATGAPAGAKDPLDRVYRAMRIADASINRALVKAGEKVTVRYTIRNQSKEPLAVPQSKGERGLVIGTRQHWVERVGEDDTIEAMPKRAGRDGRRYAAGGELIPSKGRFVPGDGVPGAVTVDTKGFAPGKYRCIVQYKRGSERDEVIQEWSIEFEVE